MVFETGSDNEKIDDIQRQLDDVLDSQISAVDGNANLSIDSSRGARNAASGDDGGVRSSQPIIHNITDVDESGTSTGVFDKINLISSMIIVNHTSTPIELRYIQGPAKDGVKIIITPKEGKSLVIKSGGNILTGDDIEISDTQFLILIKHSEIETGVTGGAYKIIIGSGGGDLSQWSTFPAVSDIDFATWDGKNIDRLFFVVDSGTFVNTDNVILLSNAGFNWNLGDTGDNYIFRHSSIISFEIKPTIALTKELNPFTDNIYDIGSPAKNYKDSYIRNLKEVRNISGPNPSNSLMKIIFDAHEDSDTYFSNSTSTPNRINAVVNGVNIWFWVESEGGYSIELGTSVNIQFAINGNWIHFEPRTAQDPANNSESNVFMDIADDILKVRKKSSTGVLSTVSLEGAQGPPGTVDGVQDALPWLLHETSQYDNEVFMSNSKVGAGTTTVTKFEDLLYFVPIYLAKRTRLTSLAVTISAPAPAGTYTLSFGIYANRTDGQNYPEDRIVSGNLLSTGIGNKRINFTGSNLEAGLYWLAFNCVTDDLEMEYFVEGNCNSVGYKLNSVSNRFDPLIGLFTNSTATLLPSTAPDDLIEAAQSSNSVPAVYAKFIPNTS